MVRLKDKFDGRPFSSKNKLYMLQSIKNERNHFFVEKKLNHNKGNVS